MAINKRVSLRKFIDDIRRWVDEDKSDDWIASALGAGGNPLASISARSGLRPALVGTAFRGLSAFACGTC